MKKINLNVIASLVTAEALYKSNLDEKEVMILQSFLLVLRKEKLLVSNIEANNLNDFKNEIKLITESTQNQSLLKVYNTWLVPILNKVRRHYLFSTVNAYANLSDEYLMKNGKDLFDNQLNGYFNSVGKRNSDAIQPQELTELFNYFLDKDKVIDYYNPFAGLASLALNLPQNVSYYGEELEELSCMLGSLRMIMYNCPKHFLLKHTNSIENWSVGSEKRYDHIAFNPPFNLKLDEAYNHFLHVSEYGSQRNANSLIISECFKKLNNDGLMVLLVPNGFLFSKQKNELALKKYLVDNHHIKSIISLPKRIFVFSGVSANLLILSKSEVGSTIFVDATTCIKKESSKVQIIDTDQVKNVLNSISSHLKKEIKVEQIIENGYDLSVHRYVYEELNLNPEEELQLQPLSELVIPVTRQKIQEKSGKFLRMSDLSNDEINYTKSFENLLNRDLRGNANLLPNQSLLLSLVSNDIRPTFYNKYSDENIYYPYLLTFACTVKTEIIDVDYLIIELHKDYVKNQLNRLRDGTVMSKIRVKELLSIEIVVPSPAEQKQKTYLFKDFVIQEKKSEVKELMHSYGIDVADENSFLRHQIAGRLKNARGAFKSIKSIFENEILSRIPELYNLKINDALNIKLGDYMQILERDLNSINQSVNISNEAIDFSNINVERIGLIQFTTKYVQEIKSRTSNIFKIDLNVDQNALIENQIKEIYINGDKELLRRLFDNILDNAEKHGFNNTISHLNKNEILFIYDFKDLEVQVDFTNTGIPLPENYSWESFTRKGSKHGANGGEGYGGWLMNEIMKKHGGKLSFSDETGAEGINNEWATAIELSFPFEINK
ncbi:N-6 DNA methylase [Gelidibacter salicanalis]|uniref:site-specific DNA-methyltransferase (adenine-specific) n=1 Tax=Gelidibacter salicanalis TaxID=291193 RepID=A0A5C7AIZ9_9FLAO|nr:N-6 DNA methylase [Gelidibacter salicanalis]TXE08558.1 N-6 DNA methylase [Gelidibacter salicanalis]